eukprot:scaffold17030_cov86-Skeletonema_marinoi.AAC.2
MPYSAKNPTSDAPSSTHLSSKGKESQTYVLRLRRTRRNSLHCKQSRELHRINEDLNIAVATFLATAKYCANPAYKRQVEVMSLVNPSISLAAPTPTAYRHHEGKRQSNRQLKKGQDSSTTLPSDFLRFRMDSAAEKYWTVPMTGTNVAALGDAMAHNNLSILYRKGDGAEKDEKKIEESIPALEEAAFAIAIASHHEIWI